MVDWDGVAGGGALLCGDGGNDTRGRAHGRLCRRVGPLPFPQRMWGPLPRLRLLVLLLGQFCPLSRVCWPPRVSLGQKDPKVFWMVPGHGRADCSRSGTGQGFMSVLRGGINKVRNEPVKPHSFPSSSVIMWGSCGHVRVGCVPQMVFALPLEVSECSAQEICLSALT